MNRKKVLSAIACITAGTLLAEAQTRPAPLPSPATSTASAPARLAWTIKFKEVTIQVLHPASWKPSKTKDEKPFLVQQGSNEQEVLAGISFEVRSTAEPMPLAKLLDDLAAAREKEGMKDIVKSPDLAHGRATLQYTAVEPGGLPVTASQRIECVHDKLFVIMTAIAPTARWPRYERQIVDIMDSLSYVASAWDIPLADVTVTVPVLPGWQRARSSDKSSIPTLYVPGPGRGTASVAIQFEAMPLKDTTLAAFTDDLVKRMEILGAVIREKKIAADGKSATLEYSAAIAGAAGLVDIVCRERFLLHNGQVVTVREQFARESMPAFDKVSGKIVGSIALGPARSGPQEDLPKLDTSPLVLDEKLIDWNYEEAGVKVLIKHPASWKRSKFADGRPLVYLPGVGENDIVAFVAFDVKRGLNGRTLGAIVNGIVKEREQAGQKDIKTTLQPGGKSATLEYAFIKEGVPVTARQIFIMVNNDAVYMASAQSSTEHWGNFQRQLQAIAESARVTFGRP